MFSRKKERISILFHPDRMEEEKKEQMSEMWSDYSLTNIANQVMNLLPFVLTQQQQNIKTLQYI